MKAFFGHEFILDLACKFHLLHLDYSEQSQQQMCGGEEPDQGGEHHQDDQRERDHLRVLSEHLRGVPV